MITAGRNGCIQTRVFPTTLPSPMNIPAPLRCLTLLLLVCCTGPLRAVETDELAAVRAADDERVAAIIAADPARLDAIFSDDLGYTHSNGQHDTKKSYMDTLVTRTTIYRTYDYQKRDFRLVSPDVALMTARVFITSANNGNEVALDLSVLAAFRKENGKWRFIAWQSARMPAPAAK